MEKFIRECLLQMVAAVERFHGSLIAMIGYSDGVANTPRKDESPQTSNETCPKQNSAPQLTNVEPVRSPPSPQQLDE